MYLTLVTCALSISSFAQNTSSHLTFKGVPIDGTGKAFIANIQQKGFTHAGTKEDLAFLTGDFAGYKNCTIVVPMKNKDVVWTIIVFFPACNDWASVEYDYLYLKSVLSEKYGKPAQCIEEFQNRAPSNNDDRFFELSKNKCNYTCLFEVPNGRIELKIIYDDQIGALARISYVDKINIDVVVQAERQAAMDDL